MKKTIITFLAAGLLLITGLKAQTIQEGINHLYAQRYKSANDVFQKLLAVNPNNIDAIYWQGQILLENEEIMASRIAAARQLYEKALQTTNGAPLIQVGMGHVELLENKTNEARQHFETALTMTRNSKKGDDPGIETAIGRAITDSKTGDLNYAVRLLEDAAAKDPKNTETLLQLGNAYRKAKPGEGGGPAYQTYLKALQVNPNFAVASLRLAQLFVSQKNWDFVLQYLNEAVTKDPKFTAAYYELFYYYFYRITIQPGADQLAEDQLKKYIDSKLPETDIQDQYLYAQLCWVRKDFACAVTKAESVVAALGNDTKPKVYRLLADAYYNKGDYVNAKKYTDLFMQKKVDPILSDYEIRALILDKAGGTPDEVYNTYIEGIALDTTVDAKLGFLKKGAAFFKEHNQRDKEALVIEKIIEIKPKLIINDYYDLTVAYYFSQNYAKSRDAAIIMRDKYADQMFGYDWAFKNSSLVDTVKRDSIALPDAVKLYDFSLTDTTKYKKQYISSVRFLAGYYINTAKNKDSALTYFQKWHDSDTANAVTIQGYIDQIKKMTPTKPPAKGNTKTGTPKPAAAIKPKTKTTKAIVKN
ncbi:MAG TPA: tetratricopeptide repeat protein [Chitinophagaceae bacterium]|nr:tetratricopeptide repeat protein [Chitinophagaceae bacterium]